MRTWAILTVLAGFVAAVCLPNEIGTHDLPAVGAKVVVKARNQTIKLPGKGGLLACLAAIEPQGVAAFSRCQSAVWRSGRTASIAQLNLPLLI